jgi:hypothetical protein
LDGPSGQLPENVDDERQGTQVVEDLREALEEDDKNWWKRCGFAKIPAHRK